MNRENRVSTQNGCFAPSPGFTLMELLVVISIIGLLAAILMPALSLAKQKGQSVRCISGLKQFALAYHMYAGDNQDLVPYAFVVKNQNEPAYGTGPYLDAWMAYLGGTSSNNLFKADFANCPAAANAPITVSNVPHLYLSYITTYAVNSSMPYYCDPVGKTNCGGRMTKITSPVTPSKTILMVDAGFANNNNITTPPGGVCNSFWFAAYGGSWTPLFPHGGKNYALPSWSSYYCFTDGAAVTSFFDGHVEMRKPDPTHSNLDMIPVGGPNSWPADKVVWGGY